MKTYVDSIYRGQNLYYVDQDGRLAGVTAGRPQEMNTCVVQCRQVSRTESILAEKI
jgi:hypothetical protein